MSGHKKEDGPRMDRMIDSVVAPPLLPLSFERAFDNKGMPNLVVIKAHLQREGRLSAEVATKLVRDARDILEEEPNVLSIKYPVTVVGDLHGQYFDFMRLLEVGGDPEHTQYLFLGDYVDRGCFSCEVVFYLFALKIAYPRNVHMLRGNHECRQLTSFFNFLDECCYKYDIDLYDDIMAAFDALPICGIVEKTFFCVHGGLSPDLNTLSQIKALDRLQEVPREGPMCDLLWSDPWEEGQAEEQEDQPREGGNKWFGANVTRQCSYLYGVEAVKQFLKKNKLTSVIRAHEAQVDGYKMHMLNRKSGIPRVITVFSAPNYCDVYKNKAAVIKFDNSTLNIKQFVDSPHPYYLPNFMDVFQWSLPFVAEKVTEMLSKVIRSSIDDDSEGSEDDQESTHDTKKGAALLKQKVVAVTKLLRMYKMLRQNNEAIVSLKQLTPNHQVPLGLLTQGRAAIQKALQDFGGAKLADQPNESMPEEGNTRASYTDRRSWTGSPSESGRGSVHFNFSTGEVDTSSEH